MLGRLGAVLELLGAVLWGYVGSIQFLIDFGINFESQKGSKMASKRSPKRSQIGHKTEREQITLLGPSWDRLRPVLAPFGVHLGVKHHQQPLFFTGFRDKLVF